MLLPHSGRGMEQVMLTQQHLEHLVRLMATHPSTSQAHDYLTLVTKCDLLAIANSALLKFFIICYRER